MPLPPVLPIERIAQSILLIRSQKVLLDTDLAALYEVTTKRFNEQVRRNLERFPGDFMFQLTEAEWESLRSQFATLKTGRGQHRKCLPYAFTEHGAIMAATILNTGKWGQTPFRRRELRRRARISTLWAIPSCRLELD